MAARHSAGDRSAVIVIVATEERSASVAAARNTCCAAGDRRLTRSRVESRTVGGTCSSRSFNRTHCPSRKTRSARSHMRRTDSSTASGTPPVRSCRNVVNSSEIGLPSSIEDTSAAVSPGRIGARAILSWVTPAGNRDVSRSNSELSSTSSGR